MIASRKLAAGPARTTRKRCQTGRSWNARSRSSGGMLLEVRRIARRGHVADELHIAAERQPGDLPPRALPVGPADQLAAEADREGLRRESRTAARRDSGQARGRRRAARARRRMRSRISQSGGCGSISGNSPSSPTRRATRVARSISSTSSIEPGLTKSASLKRLVDDFRDVRESESRPRGSSRPRPRWRR